MKWALIVFFYNPQADVFFKHEQIAHSSLYSTCEEVRIDLQKRDPHNLYICSEI